MRSCPDDADPAPHCPDPWEAAGDILGQENAIAVDTARTGSDDFAEFLRLVPGAYASLGHAGTKPLHNDGFILDEDILPIGASVFARLAERRAIF